MDGVTDLMDMSLSKFREMVGREAWHPRGRRESDLNEQMINNERRRWVAHAFNSVQFSSVAQL